MHHARSRAIERFARLRIGPQSRDDKALNTVYLSPLTAAWEPGDALASAPNPTVQWRPRGSYSTTSIFVLDCREFGYWPPGFFLRSGAALIAF
jgi:hypothetical protein